MNKRILAQKRIFIFQRCELHRDGFVLQRMLTSSGKLQLVCVIIVFVMSILDTLGDKAL